MKLDARQSRSLFLAGTVALPRPYPTLGTISFEGGELNFAPGGQAEKRDLLTLHEYQHGRTIVRVMIQEDVSAIFIPGERDGRGAFQISSRPYADNLEQGEWFIDTDVNEATVRARLNLPQQVSISSPDSILRGIVYIAEHRTILKITEVAETASEEVISSAAYCCCRSPNPKICC
jgi:hypothetical protein